MPFDTKTPRGAWAFFILLALAGCNTAPTYTRPEIDVPASFKETAGWKLADPNAAAVPDEWWRLFNDPVLNDLQAQVVVGNQNLAASLAQHSHHPVSRAIRILVTMNEIAPHLVDDAAHCSKTVLGCLSSVAVEGSAALSGGPETRVIPVQLHVPWRNLQDSIRRSANRPKDAKCVQCDLRRRA